MSITLSNSSTIPTNVVEVGNEISQNSLNGLAFASPPITAGNPVVGVAQISNLMVVPSVAVSGTNYNQQYDINGYPFYFKDNFYPLELVITLSNGTQCLSPARNAACPVAGTILSSASILYGSAGSQINGPSGESYSDGGGFIYQFSQSPSSVADGNCGSVNESWPAADQDIGCTDSGTPSTFYFGGSEYTWRTDGSGGGQWHYIGGGGGGCSGDTGNTSTRAATIYISELGGDYTAGYYNTREVYNSDCSTYWVDDSGPYWYAYGTYITANGDYTYYSDGVGGYYSEYTGGGTDPDPCPANGEFAYNSGDYNYYHDGNCGFYQGEYTGSGGSSYTQGDPTGNTGSRDEMVYVSQLGNSFALGTVPTAEYYNSDGTTYWSDTGSVTWNPAGTFLGNDGTDDWYTDGNGGVTNAP